MNDVFILFEQSPVYFYTIVTILGLLIGSFLNVVIHRLPIMMEREFTAEAKEFLELEAPKEPNDTYNLVVPRSCCPKCNHPISALENIPVLSYLWQKGKCKGCGVAISARYPLVETFTGILSFVVAYHFGPTWQCLLALIFTWALVALTFIDFDTMLLPDTIVLPVLWLGLIANTNVLYTDLSNAVIGAAVGYLSLWSIYWLFKLVTGKEGMGYGDFKLFALIGAWLGWQALPVTILLSSLIGAVVGISIMVIRGKDKNIAIPFGPYLALAGWVAMIWGDAINQAYLKSIGL